MRLWAYTCWAQFAGTQVPVAISPPRKQNQRERAAFCFKKSLEINPFLWCSYQALCELGNGHSHHQLTKTGSDVAAEEFFGTEGDAYVPSIPEPSKTVAAQPQTQIQPVTIQEVPKPVISTVVPEKKEEPKTKEPPRAPRQVIRIKCKQPTL